MGLFDFFTSDIAIDLGTANTLIIHKDKVVVDEPSIIAIDKNSNRVLAIGREAMQMHEKTHDNIRTIRPLKEGVIADFHAAEMMIRGMIKMIDTGRRFFPPSLRMVIDIGGGTTDIAVIALSGIVCDQSIRIAGDTFNRDILDYMRRQHNLLIGERTAERVKIEVGSALTELDDGPDDYEIRGRDLMTGIPKTIKISYSEVAFALDKSISKLEEAVLKALELSPPELSADIYERGIYLTGGGALLRGLDKRLSLKTKLPIHVADDPLRAVVRGTGMALKNLDMY